MREVIPSKESTATKKAEVCWNSSTRESDEIVLRRKQILFFAFEKLIMFLANYKSVIKELLKLFIYDSSLFSKSYGKIEAQKVS